MRYGQIEFRYSEFNGKYELVRWFDDDEGCYVIAFFDRDKEGYDMRTVGDRFFDDEDAWVVCKQALAFLNDIFSLTNPD